MARRSEASAGFSAGLVRAATLVLPAGLVRERYRQEFFADLHGLGGRARFGFAAGVLVQSLALRSAVRGGRITATDVVVPRRQRPVRCKLGMHRWRWSENPDGDAYLRCTRCGDDKGSSSAGVSMSGNVAGAMGTYGSY